MDAQRLATKPSIPATTPHHFTTSDERLMSVYDSIADVIGLCIFQQATATKADIANPNRIGVRSARYSKPINPDRNVVA